MRRLDDVKYRAYLGDRVGSATPCLPSSVPLGSGSTLRDDRTELP
jgi:hypothetical protein